MDPYGIGTMMKGVTRVAVSASRRTGKTMALIEMLRDGDRVIFTSKQEAERVRRLAKRERNIDIDTFVCEPKEGPRPLRRIGRNLIGRTIFDHGWLEQFYTEGVAEMSRDVDHWQEVFSKQDEPGDETKMATMQSIRWEV